MKRTDTSTGVKIPLLTFACLALLRACSQCFLSLLPVGLLQAWASVEHGMWFARSAEFMQTQLMQNLRWMRVIGDTIFAAGVVSLGWFVLGLKTGWSLQPDVDIDTVKLPSSRRTALVERE